MEVFVVLICCAIAAALGFFIGAMMRTSKLVTRERIRSKVQEVTAVRKGVTTYVLRDGTEITFDRLYSNVKIHRGES